MSTNFEKVKEFMTLMEQTVLTEPIVVEEKVCDLRINLIEEEVEETISAIKLFNTARDLLARISDKELIVFYVELLKYGKVNLVKETTFEDFLLDKNKCLELVIKELQREIADGLTDVLVVTYGAGAAFGFDLDACFEEVHRSNMSKLGEDNKPIKRESDGKILKGPNYFPPDLTKVIFK
jgi:predicted HAD superfamily Cof-like phosphohydrolase